MQIIGLFVKNLEAIIHFLIGDWPYYIFTFEIAAYFVMLIIYLPMWFVVNRSEKGGLPTTETA